MRIGSRKMKLSKFIRSIRDLRRLGDQKTIEVPDYRVAWDSPAVQKKALWLGTEDAWHRNRLCLTGGQECLTTATNIQPLDIVRAQVMEKGSAISAGHFNLSGI
jgi:hypothetical protein